MHVQIASVFPVQSTKLWAHLQRSASLVYVAWPLLTFASLNQNPLPEKWPVGQTIPLKPYGGGFIPLGKHFLTIVHLDEQQQTLISDEHGDLVQVWQHTITLTPIDQNRVKYTDIVEIQAGWLTFPIGLFAHLFYRYRQWRWRQLLTAA